MKNIQLPTVSMGWSMHVCMFSRMVHLLDFFSGLK